MLLRSVIPAFLSLLLLVSCGGGSGSGAGGPSGGDKVLATCDHVITQQKIETFNQKQSAFRVTGGGFSTHCWAEVNNNGVVSRVEASGYSAVRILPGLLFSTIESVPGNALPRFHMIVVPVTQDDVKSILAQMGLPYDGESSSNYEIAERVFPSFVRFGKGSLFYLDEPQLIQKVKVTEIVFGLNADEDQRAQLPSKVNQFQAGEVPLELLWYPENGILGRQIAGSANTAVNWTSVSARAVLFSSVRDAQASNSAAVLERAIDNALFWKLDLNLVNKDLPELYNFSNERWQNPAIADNTAKALLNCLKYIVKLNPASALAPVLATYERVDKYQRTTRESLQTAYDYVNGKSWSPAKFDLLVDVSEILYPNLNSRSWALALLINEKTQFDRMGSLFAAQVGSLMYKYNLASGNNESELAESIFAKISLGLTSANLNLYFGSFDAFRSNFSAGTREAEKACDQLVLTGKMTASNQSLYLSTFSWLKNTAYVNFEKAYLVVMSLTANGPLNSDKVSMLQSSFTWLTDTVYLGRTAALEKAGVYSGKVGFNNNALLRLQSYFGWLTGSVYLNRTDALQKAEAAVVDGGLQQAEIDDIKSLTDWYINTIYLNRTEALRRSENLVLQNKINSAQTQLLKDMVNWLVNELYVSKTTAVDKGEAYLLGPNPIDVAKAQQLKELVRWYINDLYIGKSDALTKGENLVLTIGYSKAQTDVMKAAVNWLKDEVYVSRSEAVTKGEIYLSQGKLTTVLLAALKAEYAAQIDLHKPKSEALKTAEAKVLGL